MCCENSTVVHYARNCKELYQDFLTGIEYHAERALEELASIVFEFVWSCLFVKKSLTNIDRQAISFVGIGGLVVKVGNATIGGGA